MFLYKITGFLQQNTTASLLKLNFNDSMRTVYAHGGGCGSRQRQVADGADVVFTDTRACLVRLIVRSDCMHLLACVVWIDQS